MNPYPRRSAASSGSNAASKKSPGDCPCARSFDLSMLMSCGSVSWTGSPASTSAVCWPFTTSWRWLTATRCGLLLAQADALECVEVDVFAEDLPGSPLPEPVEAVVVVDVCAPAV